MARTEAVYIATQEFPFDEPNSIASDVEAFWNNDIEKDGDFDISVDTAGPIDIGDPDTLDEAFDAVASHDVVDDKLVSYDAAMVMDGRNVSGGTGRAHVGQAGTDIGFGYSENYTDTAVHELGHIYGCSHDGDVTHWQNFGWYSHDIMGYDGVDPSCNGNEPNLTREITFKACAKNKIREYIKDNL